MSVLIKKWSLLGLGLCLLWAAPILGEGAVDAQKQRIRVLDASHVDTIFA